MTLQERIDFILNKHFPASVKRKHLSHLMLHLGDYSEDADELGEAYDRICTALEQLDNERDEQRAIELFTQSHFGKVPTKPFTVTELDRTLEFFLTYNILSMQQVQEIRAKAAAYLR
jgi:hypothetical protein